MIRPQQEARLEAMLAHERFEIRLGNVVGILCVLALLVVTVVGI